ncbi:replication initiator [Streptosporangium amethystogenes]|uniref:replication initiator n=1 Tax=Streptosporangium amethystogenes TaxID=2002 RepID=UPI001FE19337|nr:replication initiator [Streptosporangium amethystogenes]
MAQTLATEVVEQVAIENGVCLHSIPMRVTDTHSSSAEIVNLPCGSTQESKCPPCARRAKALRAVQCREGWHMEAEPVRAPAEATEEQRRLVMVRAQWEAWRAEAAELGESTDAIGLAIADLDAEIERSGLGGDVLGRAVPVKRTRSTRRRQDAPDLPRRQRSSSTVGRTYAAPDGRAYRPSMFVTLTLPSYGRVRNGVPIDPGTYDYRRAARDAIHFSKLVDRFVQNLRRVAGFDVQYFASVEPQRRLAVHLHMAVRGTVSRADLRAVVAATYHQVWWPPCDEVRYPAGCLPVWVAGDGEDGEGGYVDPSTGEVLPSWDEALARLDADDEATPLHVARFGDQMDMQGVLAGTPDADQRIRYLAKYLTKSLGGGIGAEDHARAAHAARLVEALRYEPCSAACANWLRFGVQPKGAKAGMVPGRCRGKAHKPEHLGYGGRRVLVSRKWSNKSLGEHRQDRRAWVLEVLGLAGEDGGVREVGRYIWRPVPVGDVSLPTRRVRLLREVARAQAWRAHLAELQARAREVDLPPELGEDQMIMASAGCGSAKIV